MSNKNPTKDDSVWFFRMTLGPVIAFNDVDEALPSESGVFHFLTNDVRLEFTAPSNFLPALGYAQDRLLSFANALAFYQEQRVDLELPDWVELQRGPPVKPIFGKIRRAQEPDWQFETTLLPSIVETTDLSIKHPVLRFALDDYRRGLANQREFLVHLYRAVEDIQFYLGGWERITEDLRLDKKDWDDRFKGVANRFRHSRLRNEPFKISGSERAKAEQIGREIIDRFIDHLRELGPS